MHLWNNPDKTPKPGAPIAAFDYDETLGRGGVLHWKFCPHLADLGLIRSPHEDEQLKQVTEARARREGSYRDYDERFIKIASARYAEAGLSRKILAEHARTFVANMAVQKEQYAFSRALLEVLREQGYVLIVISLSPFEILHPLAERLGFHHAIGNIMHTDENDIFTGVDGRLPVKEEDLKELVEKHQYSFKNSFAIGDSSTDLGMLKLADTGIAFNPKPSLRQALDADAANSSIIRVVERGEVMTFTQANPFKEGEQPTLIERAMEDVIPTAVAEPIRKKLESIGYYLL